MKDFEGKQNKPRNYPIILSSKMCSYLKTVNALFGSYFLPLKQSHFQEIRRWVSNVYLPCGSTGESMHCWTQAGTLWGWALSSLCPSYAYLLGEAGPDTDALTVLSSEDPFPSPLSQHHIDPGVDEDSHSKGHVERHH